MNTEYDFIVVGAGISGSFIAHELAKEKMRGLVIEAGKSFQKSEYPKEEIDANSQLYWSGGVEFNHDATLGLLRPKAVGGGSVVNQALVDRFDDIALESWRNQSGLSFFTQESLAPYYEKAESMISIQTIPTEYRNGNAKIFEEGFKKNGFQCAPLRRAQKDCRYEDGNDCIECLAGCRIRSKQSTGDTVLKTAQESGFVSLISEAEVLKVNETSNHVQVLVRTRGGIQQTFTAKKLVLAAGAIGNSALLLKSGFKSRLPAVGQGFYTHPQYMTLARYKHAVHAEKGPFQAFKSNDPGFRKAGFKLENVFAPPVSIATLLPGIGKEHMKSMQEITHYACIEVAVRDTHPGTITVSRFGKIRVQKSLNAEDLRRKSAGLRAVDQIFHSTGAEKVYPGTFGIGLHLMGGCALGENPKNSVVGADFRLHGSKRIYSADSSTFPNAPGINPSLTIMALSLMAGEKIIAAGSTS